MKKFLLALLVVAAVSLVMPTETQALGGHKSNKPHKPKKSNGNTGGGNSAPIDGGLSLLLAAGLGLGAKKVYDKNKKAANTDAI